MGGSAAVKFAREGFQIAAMSRRAETFAPTEAKLKEIGASFQFYAMDATDSAAVASVFTAAAVRHVHASFSPAKTFHFDLTTVLLC